MIESPRNIDRNSRFDWRAELAPATRKWFIENRGKDAEIDETLGKYDELLDSIVEMAETEGVDFKKVSEKTIAQLSGNGGDIYNQEQMALQAKKSSPLAEMFLWAREKGLMTPKEFEDLWGGFILRY